MGLFNAVAFEPATAFVEPFTAAVTVTFDIAEMVAVTFGAAEVAVVVGAAVEVEVVVVEIYDGAGGAGQAIGLGIGPDTERRPVRVGTAERRCLRS